MILRKRNSVSLDWTEQRNPGRSFLFPTYACRYDPPEPRKERPSIHGTRTVVSLVVE